MARRMSCSMTVDAVRDRTKTVTRRHVDTWKDLKPGDRLTLIEKGMGLPKGARQIVLAEVEIVSAYVTPLATIHAEHDGTAREGLPNMTTHQFIAFWCEGHGYRHATDAMEVPCRRIEWRYLDEEPAFELPTCPKCDRTVVTNLCQTDARTPESRSALSAVLLAAHDRLVHQSVAPASDQEAQP